MARFQTRQMAVVRYVGLWYVQKGMEGGTMEQDCHVEPVRKVANVEDLADARIVALAVSGMGCVNCGTRVRNGLLALDGVVSADVDWEQGLAFVDYVPARTNVDAILCAVSAAGNDGHHQYRAKVIP